MANIYKRSQIHLYHNYEDQDANPLENKFSLSQGLSSCSMDVPTEWHVSTNALRLTSGQDVVTNVASSILGNAAAVLAEQGRAELAEGTLTTDLAAETTRAQAAELTLTTDLAAETTRAQAAELTLTTDLAAETTRATQAEGTLAADLAAEKARIDAIVALPIDDLDTFKEITEAYRNADSNLQNLITNLTTNFNTLLTDFNDLKAVVDSLAPPPEAP